jgi:hypothetical protein
MKRQMMKTCRQTNRRGQRMKRQMMKTCRQTNRRGQMMKTHRLTKQRHPLAILQQNLLLMSPHRNKNQK